MSKWLVTRHPQGCVALDEVPLLSYAEWFADLSALLGDRSHHVASCFAAPEPDGSLRFLALVLDDLSGEVGIGSCLHPAQGEVLPSLTAVRPAMHAFERDIAERFGVCYADHPWLKPLRFPADRFDRSSTAARYPYYSVDGASLHEVNVGPIHAGIIEPGVFRFICNGEEIVHLEIVLGFQHRGIERLICATDGRLRQTALAENMAGDSVVAHTTTFARLIESLGPDEARRRVADSGLPRERAVALEMERVAVHLADTGALCMDIGYQLGQVACEALRTIVINTMQRWCGNRFSKGLVRPFGSHYPLTDELRAMILENLTEVGRRFEAVARNLENTPSVLGRLEDCGVVTEAQALRIGAVGMAARTSGVARDLRATHPWDVYRDEIRHVPLVHRSGDVMARLRVRLDEVRQSIGYIARWLDDYRPKAALCPEYGLPLRPDSLAYRRVARGDLPYGIDRRPGASCRLPRGRCVVA